jgi:hypothetical protein
MAFPFGKPTEDLVLSLDKPPTPPDKVVYEGVEYCIFEAPDSDWRSRHWSDDRTVAAGLYLGSDRTNCLGVLHADFDVRKEEIQSVQWLKPEFLFAHKQRGGSCFRRTHNSLCGDECVMFYHMQNKNQEVPANLPARIDWKDSLDEEERELLEKARRQCDINDHQFFIRQRPTLADSAATAMLVHTAAGNMQARFGKRT